MSNAKERILRFLEEEGLPVRQFELAAGLSNGYMHQLRSTPSQAKLDAIANAFPSLNLDWVLTGKGNKRNGEESVEIDNHSAVPYYDVDFNLGYDEFLDTPATVPENFIVMPGYEKATLWCSASGQSMEPEISNGDKIALLRIEDPTFLPYGDIYAIVATNGMRTIKRLGRASREGYYRLIPTNKEYDEQEIPISMIRAVFRVLGTLKTF